MNSKLKPTCPTCNAALEILVVHKNGTKIYWCKKCKKSIEINEPSK